MVSSGECAGHEVGTPSPLHLFESYIFKFCPTTSAECKAAPHSLAEKSLNRKVVARQNCHISVTLCSIQESFEKCKTLTTVLLSSFYFKFAGCKRHVLAPAVRSVDCERLKRGVRMAAGTGGSGVLWYSLPVTFLLFSLELNSSNG